MGGGMEFSDRLGCKEYKGLRLIVVFRIFRFVFYNRGDSFFIFCVRFVRDVFFRNIV